MGHEHDGFAHFALDPQKLVLQALSGNPVDGTEGLIHQQHRRIGAQRPGYPDPLPLSAGELVRVAVCESARVEADQLEQLADPARDPTLVPTQQARDGRDVVGNREMREEADVLDHVAHPQPQRHGVGMSHILVIVQDAPAARLDEPVDHFQGRRLAAARGADKHGELPGVELDRQVPHRQLRPVPLADLFQPNH